MEMRSKRRRKRPLRKRCQRRKLSQSQCDQLVPNYKETLQSLQNMTG